MVFKPEAGKRIKITEAVGENGIGYPEITQIPKIASILGVTSDYLLTGERNGIVVAGHFTTDIVKTIEQFPEVGMLAHIVDVTRAVGGCVPNTAIDLAKMDRTLPLTVLGKIGDDEYGRFLTQQFSRYGINCDKITYSKNLPTSFFGMTIYPTRRAGDTVMEKVLR